MKEMEKWRRTQPSINIPGEKSRQDISRGSNQTGVAFMMIGTFPA